MVKVRYIALSRDAVKAEFGAIRDKLIALSGHYHPGRDEYRSINAISDRLIESADLLTGEKGFLSPKMSQSTNRIGDLDPIKLRIGIREEIK